MLKAGFTIAILGAIIMAVEFGVALLIGLAPTGSAGLILFGSLGYFLYMLVCSTIAFSFANLVFKAKVDFARTTLLAFFLILSGFLLYLIFSEGGPVKNNVLGKIMEQPLPFLSVLFPGVLAYVIIYFCAKKAQKREDSIS